MSEEDMLTEEDMNKVEQGIKLITATLREAHFVMTNLQRIAGNTDADIPVDAFADEPPPWAEDPWNHNGACRCDYCDAWLEVVRPGKLQCAVCYDGDPVLLIKTILTRAKEERNFIKMEDVKSLLEKA